MKLVSEQYMVGAMSSAVKIIGQGILNMKWVSCDDVLITRTIISNLVMFDLLNKAILPNIKLNNCTGNGFYMAFAWAGNMC